MIQIRQADGSVIPIPPDGHFVELINDMDKTVMMVFYQPKPGCINQIKPGDTDVDRYEGMFSKQGVRFSNLMLERR